MGQLKDKYRQLRLQQELTQSGLSDRSGVSLGSVKRFESSGQISLESLLKISLVLGCLDDFSAVANIQEPAVKSLDQLINNKEKPIKKRGSIR